MANAIHLPFPPSAWTLYTGSGRKRRKASAYDMWIVDAGKELMVQRPAKHDGPVSVDIVATLPSKRLYDIDNLIKPTIDLLVRHRLIVDDNWRFLKDLRIRLAPEGTNSEPGLVVIVNALDAKEA